MVRVFPFFSNSRKCSKFRTQNRCALLLELLYIAPISLSFFSTAWFGSPSSGRL